MSQRYGIKLKETAKTSPKNAGMSQKRCPQPRKQQTGTNKQSRQAPIMADECKKTPPVRRGQEVAITKFKVFSPFGAEKVF